MRDCLQVGSGAYLRPWSGREVRSRLRDHAVDPQVGGGLASVVDPE
jgi:hypothetical protein